MRSFRSFLFPLLLVVLPLLLQKGNGMSLRKKRALRSSYPAFYEDKEWISQPCTAGGGKCHQDVGIFCCSGTCGTNNACEYMQYGWGKTPPDFWPTHGWGRPNAPGMELDKPKNSTG